MSSDSVEHLQKQKEGVTDSIDTVQEDIAAVEEKISRLRKALSSLQTSIHSLRNIKGEIEDFDVTKEKWKGDEEENFEGKYNSYNIFVDVYDSDTSKAREQINSALEAAKREKAQLEIGMENMQDSLDNLNSDIKDAKED